MIGRIKAISPCVKSASAKLFLDLHTVLAPSGEERTLDAAAQVERAGRCCRRFDGRTHACCGRAAVMVLVSTAPGPHVRGCIRAPRHFGPYMVPRYLFWLIRAGTHETAYVRWLFMFMRMRVPPRGASLSLCAPLSALTLSELRGTKRKPKAVLPTTKSFGSLQTEARVKSRSFGLISHN